MNKLSYGLLSFLSTEPQTGYDLMRRLNIFWHTNHSAIYPLLSELEEKGYVQFTLIEQSGKPDKKLYRITAQGMDVLKDWILSATDAAVVKDEMILKLLCIQVLEKELVEALLVEMENKCKQELDCCLKYLEKLKADGFGITSLNSPKIGTFLLTQKRVGEIKLNLKWCSWVRSFYENGGKVDFYENLFR